MPTPSHRRIRIGRALAVALCGAGFVLLAGCAAQTPHAGNKAAAAPKVVTVPRLQTMLEQGEAMSVMLAEIDGSGTVYRLTLEQREGLRADGMPASLLDLMQATYETALRAKPDLATSNERWMKIGDYWYGGLPAGWPREWMTGAR
jgi:hypothetical protein